MPSPREQSRATATIDYASGARTPRALPGRRLVLGLLESLLLLLIGIGAGVAVYRVLTSGGYLERAKWDDYLGTIALSLVSVVFLLVGVVHAIATIRAILGNPN